jgi:hypothetical protein
MKWEKSKTITKNTTGCQEPKKKLKLGNAYK